MITTVAIRFKNKSEEIMLPTNPENIKIDRASSAIKTEIATLGEIGIPTTPALATIKIDSLFWYDLLREGSFSYNTVGQYVDWFTNWQVSKQPMRFIVEELKYDYWVICEAFNYDVKAGEENDVYYELSLSEFRPYGAKIIQPPVAATSPNQVLKPAPPRVDNKPVIGITYTVESGDTLWSISKKLSAKGGENWRELYDVNIDTIGANPNLVRAGQELIIPISWRT